MQSEAKRLNLQVMRKYLTYIVLSCVLLMTGSCDFLRRSAGRPTSSELEAKRQAIETIEARKQAAADSIALEEQLRLKYSVDSAAVMDSLARMGCFIRSESETGLVRGPRLDRRYWIATGAFRQEANASRRRQRLESEGFECETVGCKGLTLILAAPNDSITGLYRDLLRYRSSDVATADVWIFDSKPVNQDD